MCGERSADGGGPGGVYSGAQTGQFAVCIPGGAEQYLFGMDDGCGERHGVRVELQGLYLHDGLDGLLHGVGGGEHDPFHGPKGIQRDVHRFVGNLFRSLYPLHRRLGQCDTHGQRNVNYG